MKHVLYLIGPALGFLGCTALILSALFKEGLLMRLRRHKPLSKETQQQLDHVGDLLDPCVDIHTMRTIPTLDIVYLYLNSRENRRIANKSHVDLQRPDCLMFLNRISSDHTRIRNLSFAALLERGIGTLMHWQPLYSHVLLWTYAEEQELLAHLAEHCDPEQVQVISLRV